MRERERETFITSHYAREASRAQISPVGPQRSRAVRSVGVPGDTIVACRDSMLPLSTLTSATMITDNPPSLGSARNTYSLSNPSSQPERSIDAHR